EHDSGASHSPAAERHTIDVEAKPSPGHAALAPVQVSATSHTPADARQTAPALPAGCWQATLVPLHWSTVHGLPSSVHALPADRFASAGQLGPLPEHDSAASQSSAAARQIVPDDVKPSAGQPVLVPVQVSATSQAPAA